ncbi:hypothetical protein K1W69_22215 [Hoeflea sp. WL0058]|uniref:Uncharacterized protein n=1 Tax=Flavimaribacter sediminis TaxID=2865987 RepID=A0AAE2ZS76_9HYPH|nr:hypothetical protein [Flavimaribacter sediminis]MBW8639927.1 hypothetical protein [Flavimaribacter sediminis]
MAALKPQTGPDIEHRLACSQGRRDEGPNVELAEELAEADDAGGVKAVAECLTFGSSAIQSDAVKVLYEIGARKPHLIVQHMAILMERLQSNNNRIVWGSLTALACVAEVAPHKIAGQHLNVILDAADRGSVIAKDQAMNILIALMLERLETAAVNQLPLYAERIFPVLDKSEYRAFRDVLMRRLDDHMAQSKRKRIEKIIRKLER